MNGEVSFVRANRQSVWVTLERTMPPPRPPKLRMMGSLLARFAGDMDAPGRKDPPGPQTLWLEMQRMDHLAPAWSPSALGQLPAGRKRKLACHSEIDALGYQRWAISVGLSALGYQR